MSKLNYVRALAVLLSAGWLATGCASSDEYVYRSTPHVPKSVALVDTAADQTLWSLDVPVGHEVTIDLDRPNDADGVHTPNMPASRMTWKLYEYSPQSPKPGTGTRTRVDQGVVNLPGHPVMIVMTLREPGLPATSTPAPTLDAQPQTQPEPAPAADPSPQPEPRSELEPVAEPAPVAEPKPAPMEGSTPGGEAAEVLEPESEPQEGIILQFDVPSAPVEPVK